MTSDASPYSQVPPPPPAPAARGWSGSDVIIGGALVVLLIALFLPWFSGTVHLFKSAAVAGTGDGPEAHGYLWVVFVLAIVALIVLVARDAIARLPGNLPSAEQMLVGATGLALLLTILGLAQKPASGAVISVGWSYGGFVAVAAALVAFVAAFGTAGPLESVHRAAEARLRRGPS